MTNREIYEWLCASPLLAGEKVNLDYLPTYEGWSMTMPRRRTDTDILGNAWEAVEINITRRKSISGALLGKAKPAGRLQSHPGGHRKAEKPQFIRNRGFCPDDKAGRILGRMQPQKHIVRIDPK